MKRNVLITSFGLNVVIIIFTIQLASAEDISSNKLVTYENPSFRVKIMYPFPWQKEVLYPLTYENPSSSFLANFTSPSKNVTGLARVVIEVENLSSANVELDE